MQPCGPFSNRRLSSSVVKSTSTFITSSRDRDDPLAVPEMESTLSSSLLDSLISCAKWLRPLDPSRKIFKFPLPFQLHLWIFSWAFFETHILLLVRIFFLAFQTVNIFQNRRWKSSFCVSRWFFLEFFWKHGQKFIHCEKECNLMSQQ